jgi:hypothetical protein
MTILSNLFSREPKELPWIAEGKKPFGWHETRDNAKLREWLRSDGKTLGDPKALPWCFPGEVEILTNLGWQRFDELTASQVYQVDEHNRLSLTDYQSIVKQYSGPAYDIQSAGVDVVCDVGHKWWGSWKSSGTERIAEPNRFGTLDEIHKNWGLAVPNLQGVLQTPAHFTDEQLHFLAAFISDGKINRGVIEFEVSKNRKITSLQSLNPDHVYTQPRAYGPTTKIPLTVFRFKNVPEWFQDVFDSYKKIKYEFAGMLSAEQARTFLAFYASYDGHTKTTGRVTLYTSCVHTLDVLSHLAAVAGYKAGIHNRGLHGFAKKDSWCIDYVAVVGGVKASKIMRRNVNIVDYEGFMYCVSVPQKRIVIRGRNGKAVITGNCGDYAETAIKKALPTEPFPGELGKNPYWARNWALFGVATPPVYGCVLVFQREGGGHVGFAVGEDATDYYVLGGNQSDSVNIVRISKGRMIASRWPSTFPNPNRPLPRMQPSNIPKSTNEF